MKSADHAHSPKKSRRAFVSLSQCVQCVKQHLNVYLPHARLIVGAVSRALPYPAVAAVAWWRQREGEISGNYFCSRKLLRQLVCFSIIQPWIVWGFGAGFTMCGNFPKPWFFGKFLEKNILQKCFSDKKKYFLKKEKNFFFQLLNLAITSLKEGSNETWSRFSELEDWWSLSCEAHTKANKLDQLWDERSSDVAVTRSRVTRTLACPR